MTEVTGILIADIDSAINRLNNGSHYERREVAADKVLTAVQKQQFLKLLAADEKAQKASRERDTQVAKFRSMTGAARGACAKANFYLDTRYGKDNWSRYILRETEEAARTRMEGKAEERKKKAAKLKDLRVRVLAAAASSADLTPFLAEFNEIR